MAKYKAYHIPQGEPCSLCGFLLLEHRVEHKPHGNPCKKCGLAETNHKYRKTYNHSFSPDCNGKYALCKICGCPESQHRPSHKYIDSNGRCEKCGMTEGKHRNYRSDYERITYLGIDGEGQGRNPHRYVMLAVSNEAGDRTWVVEAAPGGQLRTDQCLDLILSLPSKRAKIFSFSFNYDITKMLQDVDDHTLFRLVHPELRKRPKSDGMKGPKPVKWGEYWLNLQGTKFSVGRGKKRVVIWDLFKFFQAKFVNAIKDWKVGNPELWDRMQLMKDKRSEFDKESPEAVKAYCLEECKCIAELAHKLVDAHESAGLKLTSFYGAGSSGGAMLTAMGIKDEIKPCIPEMQEGVASAFFGGRFEHSVIGAVEGELEGWDISSAYPYHTTFLPCLRHGFWKHTTSRTGLDGARFALVSYDLVLSTKNHNFSWGPFPFREPDGSISFPISSGGGWIWLSEYLAGERIYPHVRFKEAWVYCCDCECRPFGRIPHYYIERIKIGKEGPGIVIKLGVNSCYGKLAQSVGNALFNSWIWAGIITSGCRAQILDMLALHKDPANLLMVATDGIYTREKLTPPTPLDTGTWSIRTKDGIVEKPLGGWEKKIAPNGVFFARPGIYFPLNPTAKDIKEIKGRGVGKGVILENWKEIVDTWEREGVYGVARVANVSRFCGIKTSISYSAQGFRRANATDGIMPSYGNWISRRVEMTFQPMPKRQSINPDGMTLKLREFGDKVRSMPYSRAIARMSAMAKEMQAAYNEALEQPDADLTDYEPGTEF